MCNILLGWLLTQCLSLENMQRQGPAKNKPILFNTKNFINTVKVQNKNHKLHKQHLLKASLTHVLLTSSIKIEEFPDFQCD